MEGGVLLSAPKDDAKWKLSTPEARLSTCPSYSPHASAPTAKIENQGLIIHSKEPFNAEPPLDRLRAKYITPQNGFYVRGHGAIPVLDPAKHTMRVEGLINTPLALSVADIRTRFPERSVIATLQCAGNRRADMQRVRPVSGDPWAPGAIGTAEWTGVSLADVLQEAGANTASHLHVAFLSADECSADGKTFHFGASIPMTKALGPEVLLADAMNGEPLEAEHGAPLRVVVPGYAGVPARNGCTPSRSRTATPTTRCRRTTTSCFRRT